MKPDFSDLSASALDQMIDDTVARLLALKKERRKRWSILGGLDDRQVRLYKKLRGAGVARAEALAQAERPSA